MERSLRTIRALKIVLPILFVAFILVIVAFYTERSVSNGDDITTTARPEREGEQPRLISYEFEDTQTVGDRVISRIRAEKTAGFDSGWYTLDNIELDIFRENGGVYTLTAPSAEFNAETKEARADGGVLVTSEDGLELRTEAIVFEGRRLTNRVPVRFRMNQWSGTARGADLDIESEILELNEGVDVSFAGEDGESIDLTAAAAIFDRSDGSATFEPGVAVVRMGDTFESTKVKVQADQNGEKLIGMQGSGKVVLTIAPGSDLATAGPGDSPGRKRITANFFAGKFDGDGRMVAVELFAHEGRQVGVELLDEVERTVVANAARVALGPAGGAESLEFFGNVALSERSDLRRKMRAQSLVVTMDPRTGEATSAVFTGGVRYADVSNQATAERVYYDLREDTVRFSSVPGSAPTISSGPQRISADEIVAEPEGRVLRAKGRVITSIVSQPDPSGATDTVLFPQDEGTIFVNSDALVIRELDGFAAFSGSVRAWQGSNTLLAEDLQVGSAGQTITARGNVRTVLYNTAEPGGEPVKSRSDRLEARRAEQKIELVDGVVVESEGRTLSGDRAIFSFNDSQELEQIEALGNLKLRETGSGRTGSGKRALYRVTEETMLLQGDPAEITEPRGAIRGEQIVLNMKTNRVDVLQGDSPTEATYNAEPDQR